MTRTLDEFRQVAKSAMSDHKLQFIVAKVEKETKRLPGTAIDGFELKYRFVRYIEETEKINIITSVLQKTPRHLIKEKERETAHSWSDSTAEEGRCLFYRLELG